jgi:chitin disaccharide deacetylase
MKLVVTADDLGLSPGVTRGILEAHHAGAVRSASLLVTFPSSAEAAALALAEPELEVGLHIDLVGGTPAVDAARVPTLVDRGGRFHRLTALVARIAAGRVRRSELAAEIRAQAARARSLGINALAWDSHRHVHLIPQVAEVVGAIAREERVRWLRRASPAGPPSSWKAALLAVATRASARALRGIAGNDWYCDLTSLRGASPVAVARLATRSGVGELGAHPGYVDGELASRDALTTERESDLRLLLDPALRAALGGREPARRAA